MNNNKTESIITGLSASTVLGLAGIAFVLSFFAVRDLAIGLGSTPGLAWMYPIVIDGMIVVYSLTVLKKGLHSEGVRWDWSMIAVATAVSIGLNWAHVDYVFGVQTVLAIVPPVALAIAFHSFMEQIKSIVRRTGLWKSVDDLLVLIESKKDELGLAREDLKREKGVLEKAIMKLQGLAKAGQLSVDSLDMERDQLKREIAQLKRQKKRPSSSNVTLLDYLRRHPKATYATMMVATGIKSKGTVSKRIKELTASGELIKKNGSGYEVTNV